MAKTVNVPLIGKANKGTVIGVSIGGVAVSAYMIYHYQKKNQAAQAAASTAASQAASGYGYGSGSGSGTYGYGYYGYGEPGITYGYGASGGFYPQGYYGYGTPTPAAVPNATNAQWAQAAINQLTQDGYSAQTVASALGAYELGQPVTAAQESIINAAIGIEGYPPQSGPNGYPPAIHVQGTPGGGGGGGQGNKGTGLYWHSALNKFTMNGRDVNEPSGLYEIAGRQYYWHEHLHKMTLNGKRAKAPSGTATRG